MTLKTYIKDGEEVYIDDPSPTADAYAEAGWKAAEASDLGGLENAVYTQSKFTSAAVLTEPVLLEGEAIDNARSKDPENAPFDPFGVAYPAGQIPPTVQAQVTTTPNHLLPNPGDEERHPNASPIDPVTGRLMDGSNTASTPGEKLAVAQGAEATTTPLIHSYDTPPNRDEVQAEMNAKRDDPEVLPDPRGVHVKRKATPEQKAADPVGAAKLDAESTGGPTVDAPGEKVEMPADLQPSAVVKEAQGAGKDGESSQGTKRPTETARSKNTTGETK